MGQVQNEFFGHQGRRKVELPQKHRQDHHQRRRQEDISLDEKFSAPIALTPSPEDNLISLQQHSQIEHYIECLPEQYRRLFKMRFLEDYTYDEIAEKLHLPMGTVKTQIHRARERMCNLIKEGDIK